MSEQNTLSRENEFDQLMVRINSLLDNDDQKSLNFDNAALTVSKIALWLTSHKKDIKDRRAMGVVEKLERGGFREHRKLDLAKKTVATLRPPHTVAEEPAQVVAAPTVNDSGVEEQSALNPRPAMKLLNNSRKSGILCGITYKYPVDSKEVTLVHHKLAETGVSVAALQHKQSFIYPLSFPRSEVVCAVLKSDKCAERHHKEKLLLQTAHDILGSKNMCVHLPNIIPHPEIVSSDNLENFIAMEWRGTDFTTACSSRTSIISSEFDISSLFLQTVWACSSLSDRMNVVGRDMHASNFWVRAAPHGGHFLLRFELNPILQKMDLGDADDADNNCLVVFLRTKFLLTLGDWGIYERSDPHMPLPEPLQSKSQILRSNFSDPKGTESLSAAITLLDKDKSQLDRLWYTELSSPFKRSAEHLKKVSTVLRNASGATLFYEASLALESEFDGEYIRVASSFSPKISERAYFLNLNMSCFDQLQHLEWVPNRTIQATPPPLVTVSSGQELQPTAPLETPCSKRTRRALNANPSDDPAERRKVGRPPRNGLAMTQAQRSSLSYERKKQKRLQLRAEVETLRNRAIEENREQQKQLKMSSHSARNTISVPLDSSMVHVYPSELPIGGIVTPVGLGVFAVQFIPKGTRITEYCGNWLQVPIGERRRPSDRDWHHTHQLSFGAASRDVLDGIRFPKIGCGVASLINSCRGTTLSANVKFQKINEVNLKTVHAVALRDIDASEELLADYEPIII